AEIRGVVEEREPRLILRADEVDGVLEAVLVHQPAELDDLLRLALRVGRVERTAHDEQADLPAQLGVGAEHEADRAQEDVDALDLLDAADEQDEPLAFIPAEGPSGIG